MILTYENRNTEISYERKKSIHVPPHLHDAIEMVFVIEGSELNQELERTYIIWKREI